MIRKAFYMEVKPGCIEEYTKAHNPIPAELKEIMQNHGIHNYSIFHHPVVATGKWNRIRKGKTRKAALR